MFQPARPPSLTRGIGRPGNGEAAQRSDPTGRRKKTAEPRRTGPSPGQSPGKPPGEDKAKAPASKADRPASGSKARTGGKGKARGKGGKGKSKAAGSRAPVKSALAAPPDAEIFRGLTLNHFQMQALGPLREGRPVLLAAPTGAGKTLVAEIAIDESIARGKRAIYTAPVKALSNQKYRDFKAIDPETVGIMTGDVTINPGAPLLIMTTEILRNTIFENPASLDDVETVVFDEVHYMDDPERGTVWEESLIFAPPHVRFVCLSATIANLDQLGSWIANTRGQEVEVIRHRERPVPLDHYLYFPNGGLRRIDGKVRFPDQHEKAMRNRRRGGRDKDRNAVVDVLEQGGNLPALFFCFSRKECEQRALESARKRRLLDREDAEKIEALFDDICDTFEIEPDAELEELRGIVRHGIAYHHAGMLPLHKELVERMFTSGLLQLLHCTETFSLGINMPAHTVIFGALRKFDGVGFSPLKVREYQQMAGRAGRQGIDDKGMVVSVVDDHRVVPTDIERMIGNDVEPIVSRFNLSYATLINLHRTLGDKLYEAWERSFNNFQWARMSRKKREKNEQRQRDAIERRLQLLRELEYITDDDVTDKGRMAAVINGFEIPVVELYSSGILEWLDEVQLAVVIAALVFDERKNDLFRRMPPKILGNHRKSVEKCVNEAIRLERDLGIPGSIRPPNFKIGLIMQQWCQGVSFRDMSELTTAPNGDLVRTMRLTVQLLRQLRSAIPRGSPLVKLIDRTRDLLNRDEVDAARQLSLG